MSRSKIRLEKIKNELSEIDDKIEIMLEKGVSETNPKLDKFCTKQTKLGIELEFLTFVTNPTLISYPLDFNLLITEETNFGW